MLKINGSKDDDSKMLGSKITKEVFRQKDLALTGDEMPIEKIMRGG